MKTRTQYKLLGMAAACLIGNASAQTENFTALFPLDTCHFSVFGGQPHFILDPGHQLVLRGEEDGEQIEVIITPLNETKAVTLSLDGRPRTILTRVVEERESVDGDLAEISRNWYARCLETGDVYYFGEEVDFYEEGMIVGHEGAWEAGVDGAMPGIIMPGSFLLGARYFQEIAPDNAMDQGENTAMGLTVETPAGTFERCVEVTEYDPLEPDDEPSIKAYAPGVGIIADEVLRLEAHYLGEADGLPVGSHFAPFSNNRFFPFSPGWEYHYEGEEEGEMIGLTISVLDQVREFFLPVGGENMVIPTRVIEERETVDGDLYEVSRNYFAQCLETGDVYYFGEEVDFYENGVVVGHEGGWLAGVAGAGAGIVMPGHFVVGSQYYQEVAPGVAEDFAVNAADGVTMTVPVGTFTGCVRVMETNPLEPDEEPEPKTYAPGIGLINDAGILELVSFTMPGRAEGVPVLSIQDAVLLSWPLTDGLLDVEASTDLQNWLPIQQPPARHDHLNQLSVPRHPVRRFFRLSVP